MKTYRTLVRKVWGKENGKNKQKEKLMEIHISKLAEDWTNDSISDVLLT